MNITDKINLILNEDKYQEFFKKKMKEWGIKSPAELSKDQRKKFFDEIDKEWKKNQ